MKANDPFMTGTFGGKPIGATNADDRVAMTRRFSAEQCRAALRINGLQKTVKDAVQRRQRTLAREAE